ncbi:MAG TPA: hypothetical protein VII01_13930 [Solirubrobacteraceae bacterium]
MPAPQPPLVGEELLTAVTDVMVVLHERYHHRTPVTAKTSMLGGADPAGAFRTSQDAPTDDQGSQRAQPA